MTARRTLLALSLLAGIGLLSSAPARADHERVTVIYRTGGHERDYRAHSWHHLSDRHYYRGHGYRHYERHGHRWWERRRHRGHRGHRDLPHYRIHIEYGR